MLFGQKDKLLGRQECLVVFFDNLKNELLIINELKLINRVYAIVI